MKFLKWLCEFTIIAGLMFGMAWLFLKAWDDTEFVDQARAAKRMSVLDVEPPAAPTGVMPNYGASSDPRVHHYQDASTERGK